MASSTAGQLAPFIKTVGSGALLPFHNSPAGDFSGRGGARTINGGPDIFRGATFISGVTNDAAAAAMRRVIILSQGPPTRLFYEFNTQLPGAAFKFPTLPAGNYMVIDVTADASEQGLIYDWVVSGP